MSTFALPLSPSRPFDEIPRLATPPMPSILTTPPAAGQPVAPAFADVLTQFLRQTDGAQHNAAAMVESLALGEPVDVHQVMLALNEASHAVHLALQVRGKVLEAYQELMRIPL
jgi:flagellar hook-basal body complex protein FliE